ncbi:DUF5004 domain-containing protein [Pedobacter nanyangensis]|uniref:DUF5004 domain-containing protein n=1 Tax=Pedobacter nanyangensis TaxID=1562389 RepID=UPI000DE3B904|nr:DUF5004 domain-containing protein [Pedobacter nanyangensis]
MKIRLLPFLFTILALLSCETPTDYLEPGKDKKEGAAITNLEGTKWKVTSMIVGQEVSGVKNEADLFLIAENCSKDDLVHFNAGGNFIYDEGPTKCDPDAPQQESGTWSLSADKKKLTLTSNIINNTDSPIVYEAAIVNKNLTLTARETISMPNPAGGEIKMTIYTIMGFTPL